MDYIQTINTGIALHQVAKMDLFERSFGQDISASNIRLIISESELPYAYKSNDIQGTLRASAEVTEIAELFQKQLGFSTEYALDAAARFIVLCIGTYRQEMGTIITGAVKASEDDEIFMHFHDVITRAISQVIENVDEGDHIALSVSIPDYAEILAGLSEAKRS